MRNICLVVSSLFLVACVDLSTVCPYGDKITTQGVFGQIVGSGNANEENIEVQIFTILNGQKDMMFGSAMTGRAGYQFGATPSMYMVCAKTVCATVTVPTGVVELSAIDATTLTWDAQVAVPPAQTIGPCTWGD